LHEAVRVWALSAFKVRNYTDSEKIVKYIFAVCL
jgi:hypothetical protein